MRPFTASLAFSVSSAFKLRLTQVLVLLCSALLGACARDRIHVLRVSVPDQQMAVYARGVQIAQYKISTSRFGLGNQPGSNRTPLGRLEIAQKIGGGAPMGMKFKSRQPTGEIVAVDSPGRDPIVTRILWLRGLDPENANAFERMIYIHGTPQEALLGTPASYGCVRMRSRDIVDLYNTVGVGARVLITTDPLPDPLDPQHFAVQ